MEYVRLGQTGLKVSRLALGCMSYGDPDTRGAHPWALNDEHAQPFFPQDPRRGNNGGLARHIKAGKARYLGASSMYGWQFAKLQHAAAPHGWTPFVSMQNQYNLLRRQDEPELMAMCADTGVGTVPYSPQGKGRLARPWGEQSQRSSTDHVVQAFDSPLDQPVVDAVQQVAAARGVTMAQIALAWVLRHPVVCAPIVGATKPHHLTGAVAALDLHLTSDETDSLEQPYAPHGRSWF